MRILICTMESPIPPIDGLRLQVGNLFRELAREHEVRLVGLVRPEQEASGVVDAFGIDRQDRAGFRLVPRPSTGLAARLAMLPEAILRDRPLGVRQLAARLRGALREEIASFRPDVVHVTSGPLAMLTRDLAGRRSVLAALDAWHLNVEAEGMAASGLRRWLLRGEASRVRRFEAAFYGGFGVVVVVSEPDRSALAALDPTLRIEVIPNGVDVERFAPDRSGAKDPDRIVFTGVMDYAPNVTAAEFLAREVFPAVRSARPAARLALVGRSPSPRVRSLAEIPGVEVTGEVADLRPWLVGSAAYVCPMRSGTGIKNKLLEAMACALPCVGTPLAVRGMKVEAGRHLLIGAEPDELASLLVRLLDDPEAATVMGWEARAYVEREHGWRAVAAAYVATYERATIGPS